ncbi:DUF4186 family protein [Rhodococcus sp. NPDC060084]|uniref:DUF4186 family protein n=1 Tax=Rhodococcus sp. NPDC060084 TaxID=3347053 RepID=UPI003660568E
MVRKCSQRALASAPRRPYGIATRSCSRAARSSNIGGATNPTRRPPEDRAVADLRGIVTVRKHAHELSRRRLAPASRETTGGRLHTAGPVFVARHATVTRCPCLERGAACRVFADAEQQYVVEMICGWTVCQYARKPPASRWINEARRSSYDLVHGTAAEPLATVIPCPVRSVDTRNRSIFRIRPGSSAGGHFGAMDLGHARMRLPPHASSGSDEVKHGRDRRVGCVISPGWLRLREIPRGGALSRLTAELGLEMLSRNTTLRSDI